MLFDTSAKGVVDVAVTLAAACLLNAYFAQAVFSIVVVVLGCADGLFAGSSAVPVVAVVVSSEMQELVTANQVVIAVVFSVFAVQQVGSGIVLQGFPVSLVATVLIYVRKFTYSSKKNLNDGARTFDIFLEKRS